MQELRDVILDLKGVIPEPYRLILARRLAVLIGQRLSGDDHRQWLKSEGLRFMRNCDFTDPKHWVPDDIRIEPTKLAQFCQKWMTVSAFKFPEEGEDKYRPITPEQNGLRVAMLQELKTLCDTDFKPVA
jgi:hypothetical protein